MRFSAIIIAGLSVAAVQAIALPGLPAAGLLFAREDPPQIPCMHPGGIRQCRILCASQNADFYACAPTCVCHFVSTTAPPTATPTGPPAQTSDQPTAVPTPSG
ncbi:hypothetical protein CEP54_012436 [Fusarium duplospermum]|uniref:Extracellular membrane protein CFEM domain-containing protein n=1 Tax=Fusarium duplospermum TaxID=1325734 RepID=A0A428P8Q2_9HYPO|nr:hypothetical protein CEP54_012436 [Fusarium duplospermum]